MHVQSHAVQDVDARGQQPAAGGAGRPTPSTDDVVAGVKHVQRSAPGLSVVHVGQGSATSTREVCFFLQVSSPVSVGSRVRVSEWWTSAPSTSSIIHRKKGAIRFPPPTRHIFLLVNSRHLKIITAGPTQCPAVAAKYTWGLRSASTRTFDRHGNYITLNSAYFITSVRNQTYKTKSRKSIRLRLFRCTSTQWAWWAWEVSASVGWARVPKNRL